MTLNTKKIVPKDLIDSLLADYKKPEDLIGENGLLKQLTKLLVERALDAEMSEHLGLTKMHLSPTSMATPVMARARRRSRVSLVSCPLRFQGTDKAALSRS